MAPIAYVLAPHVQRWQVVRHLISDDLAARERALNHLIQHADRDPSLRRAAIGQLNVEDSANFIQIARALEFAGHWSRPAIPDDAWLRWLGLLADSDDPTAHLLAAHKLAELRDLADDPRLAPLLDQLLSESAAVDVRAAALRAAAGLAGSADDASRYLPLIAGRTLDADPQLARRAWILLGLIDPPFGYQANWRTPPPEVAEAVLWAATKTNPAQPVPALQALTAPDVDADRRRAAVYALAFAEAAEAEAALLALIRTPVHAIDADNHLQVWRAVLGVPASDRAHAALQALLAGAEAWEGDLSAALKPVVLAARYRLGLTAELPPLDSDWHALCALASWEGAADGGSPGSPRVSLPEPLPDLVRLARAEGEGVEPGDLWPLLVHADSALRDRAVLLAAERFSDEVNAGLIARLLRDYDDCAKMSGAMLSGLTGLEADLLADRLSREDVWAVRQVLRLGLWMQGRLPEVGRQLPALLTRGDLPTTSLLLAALHRGEPAGLAYLLASDGVSTRDQIELLDRRRWWPILRRYLPADAPPFWMWADPSLQRFQFDVLSNWYLLHRDDSATMVNVSEDD